MDIKPTPKRVVGKLLPVGQQSSKLWTPGDDEKQAELMEVLLVGEDVPDVSPGDLVLLDPERYSAVLNIEDDETREAVTYHVVDHKYILARMRDNAVSVPSLSAAE